MSEANSKLINPPVVQPLLAEQDTSNRSRASQYEATTKWELANPMVDMPATARVLQRLQGAPELRNPPVNSTKTVPLIAPASLAGMLGGMRAGSLPLQGPDILPARSDSSMAPRSHDYYSLLCTFLAPPQAHAQTLKSFGRYKFIRHL